MLVKMLQNFDRIHLDKDAQPASSHPPASWAAAGGRRAKEQFFPKLHLTMYAHVRLFFVYLSALSSVRYVLDTDFLIMFRKGCGRRCTRQITPTQPLFERTMLKETKLDSETNTLLQYVQYVLACLLVSASFVFPVTSFTG